MRAHTRRASAVTVSLLQLTRLCTVERPSPATHRPLPPAHALVVHQKRLLGLRVWYDMVHDRQLGSEGMHTQLPAPVHSLHPVIHELQLSSGHNGSRSTRRVGSDTTAAVVRVAIEPPPSRRRRELPSHKNHPDTQSGFARGELGSFSAVGDSADTFLQPTHATFPLSAPSGA